MIGIYSLVKLPATRLRTWISISNDVSAGMSSPGPGDIMIVETMLAVEGMSPMGIPLQEPDLTCSPFVSVLSVQKFIKFAESVRESAWVGSEDSSWPVLAELDCTLAGERKSSV
jgi:hypothetical protein